MTKEEAKQSLQHTKVYVAGKSTQIQQKLFKLGFVWRADERQPQFTGLPFLYLDEEEICAGSNMDKFSNNQKKEVSVDYILGLTWEEENPQYQFKPFDRVLVRDIQCEEWKASLYSHKNDSRKPYSYCCNGIYYNHCIPYEGNEKLVGTTNKPTKVI